MNPANWIDNLLRFGSNHPLIALAGAALLLLFAWRQPKEFFKLLVFVLVLAVALYFLSLFGGTLDEGVERKGQTVHKTERALQD